MTLPAETDVEPSDAELVDRWRGGDQRAATALVERHAAGVARYGASLGAADPEELVQDTFVRAFAALDRFRGESTLRTWLFTIARRLVQDERRSRRRRGPQVELKDSHATSGHDPLAALVAGEARERIRQALDRLSPTQREVFLLRVGEGLAYREIADVAGTTEGAARVHYHNALRTVKEFLDE